MSHPPPSRHPKNKGLGPAGARAGAELIKSLTELPEQEIPLAEIDFSDDSLRTRLPPSDEEIKSLAASIREQGLINPVTLRTSKSNPPKYQVITGFRRLAALKYLERSTIKATVRNDLVDDGSAQILAIHENKERRDLSPLEWGLLCFRLTKLQGKTIAVVEQIVGFSRSVIERLMRLATSLSDDVRKALQDRKITKETALTLAKLESAEQQNDILRKILKSALDGHPMSPHEIGAAVKAISKGEPGDGEEVVPKKLGLPATVQFSARKVIVNPPSTREEMITTYKRLTALAEEGKLDFTLKAAG